MADGEYKAVVRAMLGKEGLNYGALPKGLLKFHSYENGARTPLEEHLVEGALYAREKDSTVNVHFTVSPEHRALFEALVAKVVPGYEAHFGVTYHVSFSEQKPSTDTVAANPDNTPFRTKDGSLLFRPGGHGALIENLNDIDADVVFIKNIDNVVPDRLKDDTVKYKNCSLVCLLNSKHKHLLTCANLKAANIRWTNCARCCSLYRKNSSPRILKQRCLRTQSWQFICSKS